MIVARFVARIVAVLAGILVAAAAQAQGAPPVPTPLKVIAFDGGWNLPVWAA
ncbi:MAG: hypothetical protein ABI886_15670 [Betaproteobacteria bacterium]